MIKATNISPYDEESEYSPVKELSFNAAQYQFVGMIPFLNKAYQIWGRGAGKSTIMAWLIHTIVKTMPRSSWAIQGATFQQILTRTLPSTLAGLEQLGYHRDVHYFIGRRPPKGYDLPYQCPLDFRHYIFFLNPDKTTTGFNLFSQDREGSSRGANVDGLICDESLLLDPEMYAREAKATNRGNIRYFKDHRIHHGEFHFSSMPYGSGADFLLKAGDYYKDHYDLEGEWNKLVELQLAFLDEPSTPHRLDIWKAVLEQKKNVRFFRSKLNALFSLANVFDNIKNVGLRYILDQREAMTDVMFLIEMMNMFIKKIENSFYPTLSREKHGYKGSYNYSYLDSLDFDFSMLKSADARQDLDCDPKKPLHIGMDFGGAINWLIVAQQIPEKNRINFIKDFYVKSPKILDHLLKDFTEYYRFHEKKLVYIWPDAQGFDRVANSQDTYVEQVVKLLKKADWTVVVKNKARKNPYHHDKYLLWARILAGGEKHFPQVGFNLLNCNNLVVSMEQAPAIDDGKNKVKKDKSSEKRLKTDREKATDASDAADQIMYGLYKGVLNHRSFPNVQPGFLGN